VSANLSGDVRREVRPAVVHREDDALHLETRIQVVADEIQGRDQLSEALESVVLALKRDEDRVGGGQSVYRKEPEGRRAVEEDVVVFTGDCLNEAREPPLSLGKRGQFDLGPGQADGGRDETQAFDRTRHHEISEGSPIDEGVVHRAPGLSAIDAEAARGIALRIEVDDEDASALEGQVGRQVDDGRRLADAALLVGTGDGLAQR
jgi:hypothetical protein